jgi:hypothetical protein
MQQLVLHQDIVGLQVQMKVQIGVRVHQGQHILQVRTLHQILVQEAHIEVQEVLLKDPLVAQVDLQEAQVDLL